MHLQPRKAEPAAAETPAAVVAETAVAEPLSTAVADTAETLSTAVAETAAAETPAAAVAETAVAEPRFNRSRRHRGNASNRSRETAVAEPLATAVAEKASDKEAALGCLMQEDMQSLKPLAPAIAIGVRTEDDAMHVDEATPSVASVEPSVDS